MQINFSTDWFVSLLHNLYQSSVMCHFWVSLTRLILIEQVPPISCIYCHREKCRALHSLTRTSMISRHRFCIRQSTKWVMPCYAGCVHTIYMSKSTKTSLFNSNSYVKSNRKMLSLHSAFVFNWIYQYIPTRLDAPLDSYKMKALIIILRF